MPHCDNNLALFNQEGVSKNTAVIAKLGSCNKVGESHQIDGEVRIVQSKTDVTFCMLPNTFEWTQFVLACLQWFGIVSPWFNAVKGNMVGIVFLRRDSGNDLVFIREMTLEYSGNEMVLSGK